MNNTDTDESSTLTQRLANMLAQRIESGNFVTPASQVNITSMDAAPAVDSDEDVSNSSSFEWTSGRIAGVVIGCVAGFVLIVGIMLFVLSRSGGHATDNKCVTHGENDSPIY
jgi:hypothetical protein